MLLLVSELALSPSAHSANVVLHLYLQYLYHPPSNSRFPTIAVTGIATIIGPTHSAAKPFLHFSHDHKQPVHLAVAKPMETPLFNCVTGG